MEVFTDKLILLGFCMFLLLGVNEAREPVIAFLFAVTAGALGNYIEEKRQRYEDFNEIGNKILRMENKTMNQTNL